MLRQPLVGPARYLRQAERLSELEGGRFQHLSHMAESCGPKPACPANFSPMPPLGNPSVGAATANIASPPGVADELTPDLIPDRALDVADDLAVDIIVNYIQSGYAWLTLIPDPSLPQGFRAKQPTMVGPGMLALHEAASCRNCCSSASMLNSDSLTNPTATARGAMLRKLSTIHS